MLVEKKDNLVNDELISSIRKIVAEHSVDNISRTVAYADYYERNLEIQWAFLASMVSRNAGWNMCDLEGVHMPKLLSVRERRQLFLTYERANWFIFIDAYPQLLLYEESKKRKEPLFHLLADFHVSHFMVEEWRLFWEKGEKERLLTALIINEQNKIQKPVIEQKYFSEKVFKSMVFNIQELFHFSFVLFPTLEGKLYGVPVVDFRDVSKRIALGKKLATLLFSSPYEEDFKRFSDNTPHTGSRRDYEQYVGSQKEKEQDTPALRDVYPILPHRQTTIEDWYEKREVDVEWFAPLSEHEYEEVTSLFLKKQKQLQLLIAVGGVLHK